MTKILISVNPRRTFVAGHEFGETHLVVGESFDDAWDLFLCHEAAKGNICDHGGDPEVIAQLERGEGGCDCECTSCGDYVWTAYLWMNELQLPGEMALLAGLPEEHKY